MADQENPHKHPPEYIKPGNEEYLSYYKLQKEWKPTKCIGKISAMSSSPGPATVLLPHLIGEKDHDKTKTKAPAYTIGLKEYATPAKKFSCGPGPALYDVRKKTNKGEDVCHAPVIGEVLEGIPRETSPGPGKYDRGTADQSVYRRSPAYTMRVKTKPFSKTVQTDPAAYTLPETLGPGRSPFQNSPCYTMGERTHKTGIAQLKPGPNRYMLPSTNVTKPKAPAYTMRTKEERPKTPKTGISSPGPASNYYHMVKIHKPSTPRFTFGIRHTPFKAFQHFAAEK